MKFPTRSSFDINWKELIQKWSICMSVCQYYKFGHCKFWTLCHRQHIIEVCEDINCEISDCIKRHPRQCKFFREYNRCKFLDFCSYAHKGVTYQSDVDVIDLVSKIEQLETLVVDQRKELESKKVRTESLENNKLNYRLNHKWRHR